jgi:predicted nucleotidyltransferase component of viral defense system
MTQLDLLTVAARELFFDAAAAESNIPFEIIEKDFWVVWTLERLFSLSELSDHLTFKGGTSLSKVYDVIKRFSEDIDLSIEKEFFGFNKDNDPEKVASKNKQRAALDSLSALCSRYVQNDLVAALRTAIAEKLKTSKGWGVLKLIQMIQMTKHCNLNILVLQKKIDIFVLQ